MAVVPYVKNPTWADGPGGGTPDTAAKKNLIEAGLVDAHNMPTVAVYHNTTQAITASTDTALAFNSERHDQAGGTADTQHDTVTNNSRLTVKYAGVYVASGSVIWANNANGIRRIKIRINGTTWVAWEGFGETANDGDAPMTIQCRPQLMAVNDYFELIAWHNSTTTPLNILSSANYSPEFGMWRVG